jgi:probable phosphoglycerate mutase
VTVPRADSRSGTRPDGASPDGEAPAPSESGGEDGKPQAPPATAILLVRHGATSTTGTKLPGRAPGLHLSEVGTAQAEEAAARIVRMTTKPRPPGDEAGDGGAAGEEDGTAGGVAAVYASPLERTYETAEPIAKALGRTIEVEEGLIELDVGDWTGIDLAEARKRPEWRQIQRYPSGFAFPGGESFVAMQARLVDTMARLRARHPGETVVAVSHADPIRALVAHAMGTHLDLFQRVVVSPCSVTAVVYSSEGPVVLTVNATGETAPLVPS